MLSFTCDYLAGAHPEVMRRLAETNLETLPGYGTDGYCASAKAKIKELCACPEADVHFLVGGTQTNQAVISAMLRPYEGVVAATTGHVSLHEAGAIEYTGHKVLEIPGEYGKLSAQSIGNYLEVFYTDANHEHMVFPGMVYISFPTEYGTLYSKEELSAIYEVCQRYKLPLFIDGARLGYGLASPQNDLTLAQLAELCDVFYIGGTKVGALCGEAVVFTKSNTPPHFMTQVKQHGALLAKGRLLGIQFDTLFTDSLYFRISAHAIEMAQRVCQLLREKGYRFFLESPTNQQFVILNQEQKLRLSRDVEFDFWEKYDEGHTVVRFATSWSTRAEDVERLGELL